MTRRESAKFIRKEIEEVVRLIVKAFDGRKLLKIGNRSYLNAFRYPESYFDAKDLMLDGGSPQTLGDPPSQHQVLVDPSRLFTDRYMIPPSSLIFKWGDRIYDKKSDGRIAGGLADASMVIQSAMNELDQGEIFIKKATYTLSSSINLINKSHITIMSDGAVLVGGRIIVYGDSWAQAKRNRIIGLRFSGVGSGVRLENAYATKLEDLDFDGCNIGIELVNTKEWTERTKISNATFDNCAKGIVFRSGVLPGTDSYTGTIIDSCSFNLSVGGSVGIEIESGANIGESLLAGLKFWFKVDNTVGLKQAGVASRAVLLKPSFESFVTTPMAVYGISLEPSASYPPYIIHPNWLGFFTSRIYNPIGSWLYGVGALHADKAQAIPIGLNNIYGSAKAFSAQQGMATILPRIKITVGGSFAVGEIITVRVRFELMDGSETSITKSFTAPTSIWLSDDDYLALYPNTSILWAILIDAKTNMSSTAATVTIDWYGSGA